MLRRRGPFLRRSRRFRKRGGSLNDVLPDLKVRDRGRDDFIFQHLTQMLALSLRPRYRRQQTQQKSGRANRKVDLTFVKRHSSSIEGLEMHTWRKHPKPSHNVNIALVMRKNSSVTQETQKSQGSREPVFAKAAGLLSRTQTETQLLTDAARCSLVLWSRLFDWKRSGDCQARDPDRLASQRFPTVLARQLSPRPTTSPG